MSSDAKSAEQQAFSPAKLSSNSDLVRSLYEDMPATFSSRNSKHTQATNGPGADHLDFSNPYDVPGKNYGNEWDAEFQKYHPRRTEVLQANDGLLKELRGDAGHLNGDYKELQGDILSLRREEETDAKAHGGHITPEEKAQLLNDEKSLDQKIQTTFKSDDRGNGNGNGKGKGGGNGDGSGNGKGDGNGDGSGDGSGGGGSGNGDSIQSIIDQNTRGNQDVFPKGANPDVKWYKGVFQGAGKTPPEGYSAMTAWGVVYPQEGAQTDPTAKLDINGMETWAHLKTGGWVELQSEDKTGLNGAHYVADFHDNEHEPWQKEPLAGGGYEVDGPPDGYNDHFFLKKTGLDPSLFDNYYVTGDLKASKPNAGLIGSLGADWYENINASWPYNHAMGGSNFVALTDQWQRVTYTTATPEELKEDPPPFL